MLPTTSSLMEVRRKPLGDLSNSNKRYSLASSNFQLLTLEKAKAEQMFLTSVNEKETLHLKAIKSLTTLKAHNDTLSRERNTTILSMHSERDQFASKLLDLQKSLSNSNDAHDHQIQSQNEEFGRIMIAAEIAKASMMSEMTTLRNVSRTNKEEWTRGTSTMELLLRDLQLELDTNLLDMADKTLEGMLYI